jgi:hypothetical protein
MMEVMGDTSVAPLAGRADVVAGARPLQAHTVGFLARVATDTIESSAKHLIHMRPR